MSDLQLRALFVALLASVLVVSTLGCERFGAVPPSPNIVLIVADDQGWNGTSVEMIPGRADSQSDYYRTPQLERLAAQGMRFSQAYAASPVCSPSRAALQTGKSPARLHMTDVIEAGNTDGIRYQSLYVGKPLAPPRVRRGLPEDETTVAEMIQMSRPEYATAHFGKWHLGSGGPGRHGYDAHDGNTNNSPGELPPPNPKDTFGVTQRAADFIVEHARAGQPFFLQVSYYAVHKSILALEETVRAARARPRGRRHWLAPYAAMTRDLDTAVGTLLDVIAREGIEDETYVFYVSDNGAYVDPAPTQPTRPITTNLPLARGKSHLWEGGIRIPFVVRGPGITAGSHSATPVIGWDFLPTVRELLRIDVPLPADVEGGSLLPVLLGRASDVERPGDHLVWHFPHYVDTQGAVPHSALRSGDVVLIREAESGRAHLFDLEADIGQADDLAPKRAELARSLTVSLDAYLQTVRAGRARR